MRLLAVFVPVLLWAASATAIIPDCPDALTPARVVPWRPQAWHPPAYSSLLLSGMRVEPETGPAAGPPGNSGAHRATLAGIPVVTRPDGSRYAALGGLIRAYTVMRLTPDGGVVLECVHSADEARRRVAATASKER